MVHRITRGETIVRARPFVYALCSEHRFERCELCFGSFARCVDGRLPCSDCGYVAYCSPSCRVSIVWLCCSLIKLSVFFICLGWVSVIGLAFSRMSCHWPSSSSSHDPSDSTCFAHPACLYSQHQRRQLSWWPQGTSSTRSSNSTWQLLSFSSFISYSTV